jgi:hypothetical protein
MISRILACIRHTDAKAIIAVGRQTEFKAKHKIAIRLLGAQITAARLAATIREALENARLCWINTVCLGRANPTSQVLTVENGDETFLVSICGNLARLAFVVAIDYGSANASRHDRSGKSRCYNLHFCSFDKKVYVIISHFSNPYISPNLNCAAIAPSTGESKNDLPLL